MICMILEALFCRIYLASLYAVCRGDVEIVELLLKISTQFKNETVDEIDIRRYTVIVRYTIHGVRYTVYDIRCTVLFQLRNTKEEITTFWLNERTNNFEHSIDSNHRLRYIHIHSLNKIK